MKKLQILLYVFFISNAHTVFSMLPGQPLDYNTGPCMVTVLSKTYKSNLPEVILKNSGYLHSNALPSSDGKHPIIEYSKERTESLVKEHIADLTKKSSTRTIIVHALHEQVPLVLQHVIRHPNDINALILEGSILSDEYLLSSITDKFPSNIPIIMFHNPKDRNTPVDNACALYIHLRNKNKNIYFIPVPDEKEFDGSSTVAAIFRRIFELHKLPQLRDVCHRISNDQEIKKFQIEPFDDAKKHLISLLERERNAYYLDVAKKVALGCFGIVIFWKMVTFFTR